MQNNILPQGMDRGGWIYEGFEYPEDFFDNDHLFEPCCHSHPLNLRRCIAPAAAFDEINACTFYEPVEDPPPDGSHECAHWTSTADADDICEKHVNITKYLRQYRRAIK